METQETRRVKRTQRDYTLGFKLSVVAEVERGDLTYKQAQRKYGIQGRSTVLVWLRKHGSVGWSTAHTTSSSMPKNKTPVVPSQRIKALEAQLEDERLRNRIMQEMLTIIDQEHGSNLRKKYSAEVSARCKRKES